AVLRWATGYRQRLGLALKHLQIERAVLWSAGIASVFFAYFAAEGFEAFMLSCIAVPVFMALAVPGLLRGTKLEIGAIAVLPLVTLVDLQNYSWRPLPAFVLALVGLSLAHRRTRSLLKEITGHVRWVLELIGAGVLGAALQELTTDGDVSANGTASLIAV
ncbi:hypothetical protein BZG21_33195, partial [Escherichia coli]|nr:hypothetical protein [Escherichia coli]